MIAQPYPHGPGHSNPTTSKAAADSVAPLVNGMAAEVYALISDKPATCEEIEAALGMPHQTASARVRQLAMINMIEDSGAKRPTGSGRQAIVWRKLEMRP